MCKQTSEHQEWDAVKMLFPSPVFLAHKQIEGVLGPQEVVVIQDFHCAHPVRIEVTSDLTGEHEMHQEKKTANNTDTVLSPSPVNTALSMSRQVPKPKHAVSTCECESLNVTSICSIHAGEHEISSTTNSPISQMEPAQVDATRHWW